MSQALDLSAIQANTLDGSVLTIINPKTGQDTPMTVTLLSPDSAEYKRRVNRLQEQEARRRKLRRKSRRKRPKRLCLSVMWSQRSNLMGPSSTASPWAAGRMKCGRFIRHFLGFWIR